MDNLNTVAQHAFIYIKQLSGMFEPSISVKTTLTILDKSRTNFLILMLTLTLMFSVKGAVEIFVFVPCVNAGEI